MSKPELVYKTRGDKQSPKGKPKVFFTCADEDFDNYFEKESDTLLWMDDKTDLAIWYNKDKAYAVNGEEDRDEYYAFLHDMNMFVIPVTQNFLKGNTRAYKTDFKYALSNHIPLLMIMEERGLESLFETMCGKIQYLDRYQDEETQDSFENKLKRFLNDTLISDELAEKIRDSFDAYIFLSYRKKDRKEALEVMKTIHSNDFTRDIAIWFDENLVSGENFSDAISDALRKSCLFTMVVTPNINENPNYVMDNEYPSALLNNKQILPIEARITDKNILYENYNHLPEITPISDNKTISDKLISLLRKEAYKENNDPEHLYYIALAYLNGIDVEKDTEKGVSILSKSADYDYLPSLKELVLIYLNGKGVKLNYGKAIEYQQKILDLYKQREYTEENVLKIMSNLAFIYDQAGKYKESLSLYEEILERRKLILGENHPDTLAAISHVASKYGKLGDIKTALDMEKALYSKRKEILGEKHISTIETLSNVAYLYGEMKNYEEALEIQEEIYHNQLERYGKHDTKTIICLNNLAHTYFNVGNSQKALNLQQMVFESQKDMDGELNPMTLFFQSNMAAAYAKVQQYDKSILIYEDVYRKQEEILTINHPQTLITMGNMTFIYAKMNNYMKAIEIQKKVWNNYEQIYGQHNPLTLIALNNLAYFYAGSSDLKESVKLYKRAYEGYKKVFGDNSPRTIAIRNNISRLYSAGYKDDGVPD